MAGFIKLSVEKPPVQQINQSICSEIFEEFQRKCKQNNTPMNLIIETFCRQYVKGRYHLDVDDILKWKDYNGKTSTLNTTINKEIYEEFKSVLKVKDFYVRHVISAFIEDFATDDLILEFVRE